jgi:hypothetical protein
MNWTGARSLSGAKECIQTGYGAHTVLYPMVNGGEVRLGVMLTAHPHLVPRSRMNRNYNSSPPRAFMACGGTDLLHKLCSSLCIVDGASCYVGRCTQQERKRPFVLSQHHSENPKSYSLCNFLRRPAIFSLLGPNIRLSTEGSKAKLAVESKNTGVNMKMSKSCVK